MQFGTEIVHWVKQRRWNRGSIYKLTTAYVQRQQPEDCRIQVCKRKLQFVMKRTGHRDVRSLQKYQRSEFGRAAFNQCTFIILLHFKL